MKSIVTRALAAAVLVLAHAPAFECRSLSQERTAAPAPPVAVSRSEVRAHRIGRPAFIRAKLEPRRAAELGMEGIRLNVTVGTDGEVTSATATQDAPTELRAQAEAAERRTKFRPFERDGHAVAATFEDSVGVLPPEIQPSRHVPFPEIRNWNSIRITLTRTGCFGTCPSYCVEVQGDGTVLYEGKGFVAFHGKHGGSVSLENVRELVNKFRSADYFSLRDEYVWGTTDLPTYETSIQIDGRLKKVKDYAGLMVGMPMEVEELEESIDELSESERWTKGNADTVRALEDEHRDFTSPEAAATLARVSQYGSQEAVRDLVAAGVHPEGKDGMRISALERAALRGDSAMLTQLLDSGAGMRDPQTMAKALAAALRMGKRDAAALLLARGADLEARWADGKTMLMAAAASGVPGVVKLILRHQPDVNARDNTGQTALMDVVGQWHYGPEGPTVDRGEVTRMLLSAGADPNASDKDGNTPLIDAAWDADAALALIKAGANVNARNKDGLTPLINCVTPEVVRVLLGNGADPSARNKDGKTALELARAYSMKKKVAALEEAEAAKKQ